MLSRCALCDDPLTATNDSSEHVILNAIGGRLEIRGFICKPCNDRTGRTWDAALASQLNGLCLLFSVTRDRGAPPPMAISTTAGEKLVMRHEGGLTAAKPTFSRTETPQGVRFELSVRTMAEARKMLTGLKRKHPDIDVEGLIASAQVTRSYPEGALMQSFKVGGEDAGRSLVKSCLALAAEAGVSMASCGEALDYLRRPGAQPPFGWYYQADLVGGRSKGTPLHCVSVRADPRTGLVLGYVEFFGFHRAVVCLGRGYDGALAEATYAVDPRCGTRLDLTVDLMLPESEIAPIYNYERIPDGAMEAVLGAVLPTAIRRQAELDRDEAIANAVEYAFANCGAKEGDVLTDEQSAMLSGLVVERLQPYLLAQIARRRPR